MIDAVFALAAECPYDLPVVAADARPRPPTPDLVPATLVGRAVPQARIRVELGMAPIPPFIRNRIRALVGR